MFLHIHFHCVSPARKHRVDLRAQWWSPRSLFQLRGLGGSSRFGSGILFSTKRRKKIWRWMKVEWRPEGEGQGRSFYIEIWSFLYKGNLCGSFFTQTVGFLRRETICVVSPARKHWVGPMMASSMGPITLSIYSGTVGRGNKTWKAEDWGRRFKKTKMIINKRKL